MMVIFDRIISTPEISKFIQNYVATCMWLLSSEFRSGDLKIKLKKVMRLSKVLVDSTKSELLTEYPQRKPLNHAVTE